MSNQEEHFFDSEGDQWFLRNQNVLHADSEKWDAPIAFLERYGLTPKTVLEIGCSNGWRLGRIHKQFGSRCVGVEPSAEAIAEGQTHYSDVTFHRGLASSVPLQETFDVVIVHFVLHWVGRDLLFQALTEIDRLVAPGGYLIIGDFLPDTVVRTPYHHLPNADMFTYKIDYAAMFTATSIYKTIAHDTFVYNGRMPKADVPGNDRGACTLLRKSSIDFYPLATPVR